MIGIKTEVSPEFKRTAQRFQHSSRMIVGAELAALVRSAQVAGVKEAQNNLMKMVYNAALPDSVKDAGTYLATRRTGRTFRAVKRDEVVSIPGGSTEGTIRVDRQSFEDYYYALILNFGGRSINYASRPFWSDTERTMKLRFAIMGRIALRNATTRLAVE